MEQQRDQRHLGLWCCYEAAIYPGLNFTSEKNKTLHYLGFHGGGGDWAGVSIGGEAPPSTWTVPEQLGILLSFWRVGLSQSRQCGSPPFLLPQGGQLLELPSNTSFLKDLWKCPQLSSPKPEFDPVVFLVLCVRKDRVGPKGKAQILGLA